MAIAAGLAYSFYVGLIDISDRFNPWAPLDVMATPDFLTRYKLSRARSDPARCLQALEQTAMQYDVLPDRVTGPGCGFDNVVRLRSAGIRFGAPFMIALRSRQVWPSYNDAANLARRHGAAQCPAVENIGKALSGLAAVAVAR